MPTFSFTIDANFTCKQYLKRDSKAKISANFIPSVTLFDNPSVNPARLFG